MRATGSLLWEIWAQQRLLFNLLGLYLIGLCLVAPLLPVDLIPLTGRVFLTVPLGVGGGLLLVCCGHGFNSHQLEGSASCFPTRLLALPVSAWLLATIPFLVSTLGVGVLWLLGAGLIVQPGLPELAVVWPALEAANLAAWILVLTWLPFPLPGLRLVAFVLMFPPLVLGTTLAEYFLPPVFLWSGQVGVLGLAWLSSVGAVTLARRGVGVPGRDWLLGRTTSTPAVSTTRAGTFVSALRAQLWLNWRTMRAPYFLILAIALISGLAATECSLTALSTPGLPDEVPGVRRALDLVGPEWLSLGQLLLVPVVMVLFGNGDPGTLGPSNKDYRCPSFLAVRPVPDVFFVRAKLWVVALGTLVGWGAFLLAALLWAVLRGHWVALADRLLQALGSPERALLLVAWAVVAALVLSWAHLVKGLWLGLAGRPWLVGLGIWTAFLLWPFADWLVWWTMQEESRQQIARRLLPALLAVALLVKLAASGAVGAVLVRRGMATGKDLGWILVAWLSAFALVAGLFLWVMPVEWGAGLLAAGLVALALPLARCGLAPLAVAWNRHR
jgi:hypothetical protein